MSCFARLKTGSRAFGHDSFHIGQILRTVLASARVDCGVTQMDHPLRISRRSGLIDVGMICTYLYSGMKQILVLVSSLRLI